MAEWGTAWPYFEEALLIDTDECQIWPYAKDAGGYGRVNLNRRSRRVHILACERRHGPGPPGQDAEHGPCHGRVVLFVPAGVSPGRHRHRTTVPTVSVTAPPAEERGTDGPS